MPFTILILNTLPFAIAPAMFLFFPANPSHFDAACRREGLPGNSSEIKWPPSLHICKGIDGAYVALGPRKAPQASKVCF